MKLVITHVMFEHTEPYLCVVNKPQIYTYKTKQNMSRKGAISNFCWIINLKYYFKVLSYTFLALKY